MSQAVKGEIDITGQVDASERDKYLGWLPVSDHWQYHNAARSLRIDQTTGGWFLEKKFETWCTTPRSLLWLCSKGGLSNIANIPRSPGTNVCEAGSGKTVLSSTIIDKIRDKIRSSHSGALAFFYFSFQDNQRQDVLSFKRSLLVQLVQQISSEKSRHLTGKRPFYIPKAFYVLYTLYHPSTAPPVEDINTTLLGVLQDTPKAYIVVDAVDECLNLSDRLAVVDCLKWLSSKASCDVQILFTSRPEADIGDAFSSVSVPKEIVHFSPLEIDADISSHISRLMENKPYSRWSLGLKSKVKTHLTSRADGAFRWAELQMQELSGKAREIDVEKALRRLPETLGQTYARMLQKIDQDGYGKEALMVLRWLAYSHRPLTLAEASEIAAFQVEDESAISSDGQEVKFIPAYRFDDQWEIRRILAGLVSVAARGRDIPWVETTINARETTISLSHFSVKEYLEGHNVAPHYFHLNWHISQWLMVRASADYIRQACEMIDEVSKEQPFHLLLYVCFNIWRHISAITQFKGHPKTTTAPVLELLSQYPHILDCEFLVSPSFFQAHHGCCFEELESDLDEHEYSSTEFLENLFESHTLDVCKYETRYSRRYPLHEAAINDDVQIAQLCFRAGIPPDDLRPHNPRPEDHDELIEEPAKEFTCDTPLQLAIWHGQEDVAKLLIATGKTDVNLNSSHMMTPLLQATFAGNEGIVHALLKRPDLDVNVSDIHGRNALSLAASRGHETIIQMLLDNGGINTGLRDRLGQSIFARAAKNGHERVIEILRPMVAHVGNTLDDNDRKAIIDTLCRGSVNVLRKILEINSDMDLSSRDTWGTTVLSRAAYQGFQEIVQMLLSRSDIDPSEADNFGFTALDWARYRGNKIVADMLQSHPSFARPTETNADEDPSSSESLTGTNLGQLNISDAKSPSVDYRRITSLNAQVRETPGEIWCVAFSKDGRRLATGHGDGEISIWQSDTAKHLWTLTGTKAGIADVSWSPDDSLLLSCGRDRIARLWDPDVSLFLFGLFFLCSSPYPSIKAGSSLHRTAH